MVDAIFDLENLLLSKREQVTIQEKNLIRAWKARAQMFFYLGLGGGSAVAWLATLRLQRPPLRHVLIGGAGIACGTALCARSLESSVEHILSIQGSRVQREMANILLKKYRHDDPWVWRLVSKHFYPEEVYEDSSADKPVFRWRYRNFSGESVTRSQSTTSYGGEETNPKEEKNDDTPKLKPRQQTSVTPAAAAAAAAAVTEDPFDIVLGGSESADTDDPQPTNALLEPSRRQMRKEKRSRRRRRRQRLDEESDNK